MDLINTLDLGVVLFKYADDTSLVSNGIIKGIQLERNINYINDFISYFAAKRKLYIESSKQKYMVITANNDISNHHESYLDLYINGEAIEHEYKRIRYLGYILDCNADGSLHRKYIYRNINRIFINIYNKFNKLNNINANWIQIIVNSFIISKIVYCAEFWGIVRDEYYDKIKVIYNKCIRWISGCVRSTPVPYFFFFF